MKQTSGKPTAKTTINGNPLFTGTEGKRFSSEYQPSPEAKSEGWAKKKAKEEFIERIYGKMNELSKRNDLTNREIIDLGKIAIEISGDKKNTQETTGNVVVEQVFITAEEDKETDEHIDEVIYGDT